MAVIHTIDENGVFRPKEPVDLPESSEVEVELRSVAPPAEDKHLDAIYAILETRFESGDTDVAARHNDISLDRFPDLPRHRWLTGALGPKLPVAFRW